jgi:hypothetical protein
MTETLMHSTCSHDRSDVLYAGKLVHNFSVAPYIEDGNSKAMQPSHTYQCLRCKENVTVSAR